MQPVGVGIRGELYLGGVGVGRGYLNNVELTKERFIANPFGGGVLYKTGDIVQWTVDGELEYFGRNDDQVKIRGHRIELGEIEHALLQIEGIRQSCVVVGEGEGGNKYLVGYCVVSKGHSVSSSLIIDSLSKRLPEYMIPSAIVELESFPVTVNGKIDKRALPAAELTSTEDYVAPSGELEAMLCRIWEEMLGIGKVGVTDNFFRIGGDSILSIQVSSRIRQAGYACQVKDIFLYNTIEKLSDFLRQDRESVSVKTEQGLLSGTFDLLPVQQWFMERVLLGELPEAGHWNQSFLIRVGRLDTDRLASSLEKLVSRHDMLRVNFVKDGDWHQVYKEHVIQPSLRILDVSAHTSQEAGEILTGWQSDFDLEQGPLFRFGYLEGYEDGSARIFMAFHHMIVDGVSWRILSEDLKHLYDEESLLPKGSSYRQWVESIGSYPALHVEESSYWRSQLSGLPDYARVSKGKKEERGVSSFELDNDLTSSLLQKVSGAYHTEINDLLLTGFCYALKDLYGLEEHGITIEGHGREDMDPLIDHSKTVGWFTSMFPLKLKVCSTLKESIQLVKERLRSIPGKGIGYGAFVVAGDEGFRFLDLPPVSFNYLGQFDSQDGGDWQVVTEYSGENISAANGYRNMIHCNGLVSKGRLKFSIITQIGSEQTQRLSERFRSHLVSIIEHCTAKLNGEGASFTPSDFKSVQLSQELLDEIQFEADSFEE
jgi:non-ribosomal peptide synthase protein (TIGR01720 family)